MEKKKMQKKIKNRFPIKSKPVIPHVLLKSKSSNISKMKEINVVGVNSPFTGHCKNNTLSKLGNINFWIDNKAYNFVENIHQMWLLTIANLIIGKREYLS